MAIKKSELYSSLWKMCDELRGGMDASQYKDYVLVLLFVKYVSDRYAGKADSLIEVPCGQETPTTCKCRWIQDFCHRTSHGFRMNSTETCCHTADTACTTGVCEAKISYYDGRNRL